jgi:hypothetical protein
MPKSARAPIRRHQEGAQEAKVTSSFGEFAPSSLLYQAASLDPSLRTKL